MGNKLETLVSGSPWYWWQTWPNWPSWTKRWSWQHRIPWTQRPLSKDHDFLSLNTYLLSLCHNQVFLPCSLAQFTSRQILSPHTNCRTLIPLKLYLHCGLAHGWDPEFHISTNRVLLSRASQHWVVSWIRNSKQRNSSKIHKQATKSTFRNCHRKLDIESSLT